MKYSIISKLTTHIDESQINFALLIENRKYQPGNVFVVRDEFFSLNYDINLEQTLNEGDLCLLCEIISEDKEIFQNKREITKMKMFSNNKFFFISALTLLAHAEGDSSVEDIFDTYLKKII